MVGGLKTAVWVVVLDKVLTAVVWVVMLGPAFLLLAVLPSGWAPGGTIAGLVVGALFASNIRQAFVKPVFLVMVITKFHVLVRNQAINLEWDQRLSSVSRTFGESNGRLRREGSPDRQRRVFGGRNRRPAVTLALDATVPAMSPDGPSPRDGGPRRQGRPGVHGRLLDARQPGSAILAGRLRERIGRD